MANPLRVLNLDDNDAARYARSRGLMKAGFEVLEASTGAEALEVAETGHLDVAVLDVKLPDMSGLEVTRRIKANPATRSMRIAQISAIYHSEQDEAASLQHGADIYLRSPIEPEVLPVVLETLARLRRPDLASAPPLSPLGIAHVELAGYLNQANQRFCDITGCSPQQLCRMTVGELFHWDDAALAREMFREMTQGTGRDFRKEMRLLVNGRAVWTDCSFSLVMSASGVVREAVMVIFEVPGGKSPAPAAE